MPFFGNPVADTIGAVGGAVESAGNALDNLITSDEERLIQKNKARQIDDAVDHSILDLNKQDAKAKNWFQAGWRPYWGWTIGTIMWIVMGSIYLPASFYWASYVGRTGVFIEYPVSLWPLMSLAGSLLGSKVLRTVEKVKGVAR